MFSKKQAVPTCAPKTAVAYARYSSAGQRDVSIEQQLNDIRAYAKREGYTIIHEYCDHAKSGFKNAKTRTEFQAMIAAARTGAFDTVISWKTDRFSRRREDSAVYKGKLKRLGVKIVFVMEQIPEGSAGLLLESMLEATAEWYSRTLSENIARGMNDNAKHCLHNGVKVLGYSLGSDGHYSINPETAPVVRRIFERYRSGYSSAMIARELNAEGLTNVHGRPFTHANILSAISNERYIGIYHWGDIRVPDGMPAIISKDHFEEAQQMKGKTARHVEQGAVDYLLTGKAFCGLCGAAMIGDSGTSRTGERHYYYSCQAHKARKGCPKKSHQKEFLEDTVIDFLLDNVLKEPEINRIADSVMKAQMELMKKSPLAALEKELAETNKKIDNINNAIAAGIYSNSTLTMLKDQEAKAAEIQKSISVFKLTMSQLHDRDSVIFFLQKMVKDGDRHESRFRQYLIYTFVNAVYVFDDHLKLVVNNVDGNFRMELDELPSDSDFGSDSGQFAPLNITHPNQCVTVYRIPLIPDKKRA